MVNHLPKGAWVAGQEQAVTPDAFITDKELNIYVLNSFNSNWQIEKLSSTSGKSFWKTSRNYTTPTLDSNQYFVSDFFMNNDNTVEVLGTRLSLKYPGEGLFVIGPPAKSVYDMKTGKEKSYYTIIDKVGTSSIWNRGSTERFLKKKDGYFIMDPLPYEQYYGMLRKSNNNLSNFDTLATYEADSKYKKMSSQSGFEPYLINNSIYYTVGIKTAGSFFDSTQFNYRWFKLDTMGNILKQKDINKEVYGTFAWRENKQVSDGFLWAGMADTTYSVNIEKDFHYYITKVDTNMNIKWRTFLPRQETRTNLSFQIIELKDKKGYLIFQGSRQYSDAKTFLYHVSLQGKAKYLGEVKLNESDLNFFPLCSTQLANQDIVLGFGLSRCWVNSDPAKLRECGGTALIAYKNIENLVSNDELSLENTADAYRIYPNPSNDFINLNLANEDKGVMTLFDTQGELIKIQAQTTVSTTWQIPVSEINAGIYFLQIKRSNGEIRTEKVVVVH
jgi:hypothetical protein